MCTNFPPSFIASKSQLSTQMTELKTEIKRLMFTSDEQPIVISNDRQKFKEVMCAFHKYERAVSIQSLLLLIM